MVKSALHTRTKRSLNAYEPGSRPSTMTPDSSLLPTEVDLKGSPSAIESFEIGSFNLVRTFVEHVMDKNASTVLESDGRSRLAIDWHALEALVAESRTLEQAIGRAIVIADQMSRCVFDGNHLHDAPSPQKAEDPFFSFSMADVVPDFGDESR